MTILDQIKAEIKNFEKLQVKWAHTGAQDTEPDGVFQRRLYRAVHGKSVAIPTTVDGWELFSEEEGEEPIGSEQAAMQLSAQMALIVRLIQSCPLGESEELRKYLNDYCWRVR